jgi:hypothetical protein
MTILDDIIEHAGQYNNTEQGQSCTQTSFKTNKKAFLFIGEQGGLYKAIFKLDASKEDAIQLAKTEPKNYQAGNGVWVTARFSDEEPIPTKRWQQWLEESYRLSSG